MPLITEELHYLIRRLKQSGNHLTISYPNDSPLWIHYIATNDTVYFVIASAKTSGTELPKECFKRIAIDAIQKL